MFAAETHVSNVGGKFILKPIGVLKRDGENYIMRSFITFTPRRTQLE
jgi:hypothetical protein